MIGHSGEGKGLGDVKLHWNDSSYRELVKRTNDASPISKVTRNSAPTCFVHGIYECGIQVPMGQSVRMFKAMSEQGVKSFLLCNNNSMYGEDDEIKKGGNRFCLQENIIVRHGFQVNIWRILLISVFSRYCNN